MSDENTLTQNARSQVEDISQAAKDRVTAEAEAQADAARHAAADEAQSAADAVQAAAGQFDSRSLQAQAAHRIADQIEGVATHLRTSDINSLVAQTSDFARRNPLLFIGGAAALGFAATRFLKSRDPQPPAYADNEDPWRSISGTGSTSADSHPQPVRADINGAARHG